MTPDRSTARYKSSLDLYLAVAVGGAIGASTRYGLSLAVPVDPEGWPTSTFLVNTTGCVVLGAILVIAKELFPDPHHSLVARRFRPFVVTGVLGGYTTFSTYAVEVRGMLAAGQLRLTLLYSVGSIIIGVLGVAFAMSLGERVARGLRGRHRPQSLSGAPIQPLSPIQAVEQAEAVTEEQA